ncbi:type II toxin-antitoxin system HicB family antitoxin [Cupriavidus pauculus]|uniref:Antitoxin n=1 Tax=Cupriavidus pauculus TaxID=82633 RepID=A0A2N5C248_9BURK|nr:type II toxin-antitoxin system HicB family antitoxin [Cupriavidus pauculus]PLP96285.1 antitoxin [Cupriavidus pauculus]
MRYPAIFTPAEEGGFTVTFRDIPEAITQGDDMAETLKNAADALATAMEFYFEDGRSVPLPSTAEAGEQLVDLPASVTAKVLLLNEMLAQRVTQAELARRMQCRPQEVQRVVDLSHATKIDTIAAAFQALDKHLEFRVS